MTHRPQVPTERQRVWAAVEDVTARLLPLVPREAGKWIEEYLFAGEWGLALETLCDCLSEDEISIPRAEAVVIADLAEAMGSTRYSRREIEELAAPCVTAGTPPSSGVRASVQGFHSPDADLETYRPDPADDFAVLVQVLVGLQGSGGKESFDVVVCTPRWLAREADATPSGLWLRHHFLVPAYHWPTIESRLRHRFESEVAPDWRSLGERLGRWGQWEFEDYVE